MYRHWSRGCIDGAARQHEHGAAANVCHQMCTDEVHSSALQEDGTLEGILQHRELITKVLDALCGTRGPKDADESVRQALAEAVLMLVSGCNCAQARGLADGEPLLCLGLAEAFPASISSWAAAESGVPCYMLCAARQQWPMALWYSPSGLCCCCRQSQQLARRCCGT